jgi:hypothetical protein
LTDKQTKFEADWERNTQAHETNMASLDQKMQRECPFCGSLNTTGQSNPWLCGTKGVYGRLLSRRDRTKVCLEIGRLKSIIADYENVKKNRIKE